MNYTVLTLSSKKRKNKTSLSLAIILFCITSLFLSASSSAQTDVSSSTNPAFKDILNEAENLFFSGQTDTAIKFLKDAYNSTENISDFDRYKYYLSLGEKYRRISEKDDSRSYLDSAKAISDKLFKEYDTATIALNYELAYYCIDNNIDSLALPFIEKIDSTILLTNPDNDYYRILDYHIKTKFSYKAGKFDETTDNYEKALALASEDTEEMLRMKLLLIFEYGTFCKTKADYEKSHKYLNEVYDEVNSIYGKNHIISILAVVNLAHLAKEMSEYEKADSLYNLSEELYEQYSLKNHPSYNEMRNNKAVYLWTVGRYSEVETLYKELIESEKIKTIIDKKFLGALYINLANLYYSLGRRDESLDNFEKAADIWTGYYDEDHHLFSRLYNNMAVVCGTLKDYKKAEKYQLKALKIRENSMGPDNPEVAVTLSNLADLYIRMGKTDEVEPLLKRALKIRINNHGEDHRYVAQNLEQLATFYTKNNINLEEAEELFLKATKIKEKLFSPYHPELYKNYNLVGNFYLFKKDYKKSYSYFKKLLKARQDIAEYVFSFTSEDQKLKWISSNPLLINSVFNLALLSNDSEIRDFAFEMVLKAKAIIASSVKKEREAVACNLSDELLKIYDEYIKTCEKIAEKALSVKTQKSLDDLVKVKDSLEIEITKECGEFSDFSDITDLNLNQLADQLKEDQILLEYVRFSPNDQNSFMSQSSDSFDNYLLFSLKSDSKTQMIDLGLADSINNEIIELRDELNHPTNLLFSPIGAELEQSFIEKSKKLYSSLITPIHIDRQINCFFIAPDDYLNLLSFEILHDSSSYFIENNKICYLNSGRDLLNFDQPSLNSIYIFADPTLPQKDSINNSDDDPMATRSECLDSYNLNSIRYTHKEGEHLKELAESHDKEYKCFFGDDFSEYNLKHFTEPPDILHLATHGYFCTTDSSEETNTYYSLNSGLIVSQSDDKNNDTVHDEGILSALEIISMDLNGTDLVTLSACNTGVGGIVSGEGVFGLRRSFQNAGAQAMIISLWEIPDNISYSLMSDFYERLLNGTAKSEALREATLKMFHDSKKQFGHTYPLLWGGFIQAGNPR